MKLRPYCNKCGWRKGGPDSWDGVACKCGHTEPPYDTLEEKRDHVSKLSRLIAETTNDGE
jgi:hypothetical protein